MLAEMELSYRSISPCRDALPVRWRRTLQMGSDPAVVLTANRRKDWPAVLLATSDESFYPIEVLRVATCQRVPVNKQTATQVKDTIKECAVPPANRFRDIGRNLDAPKFG